MKHIETKYINFIKLNESIENDEGYTLEDLYNMGAERITDAANLLAKEGTNEWNKYNNMDPEEIIMEIEPLNTDESKRIIDDIRNIQEMIDEFPLDENEDNW